MSVPMIRMRARYQTAGTRARRCISLATNAAPVVVNRPATAQLLLPMPRSQGAPLGTKAAGTPLPADAPRTLRISGGGMAPAVPATGPALTNPTAALGASHSVPTGYRNVKLHFQPASHSGPRI